PSTRYYDDRDDLTVRIDATYLRQDFSVKMPCYDLPHWPSRQRYDFITRIRPATPAEIAAAPQKSDTYPQREAVLHVLRELPIQKGGDSRTEWERIVQAATK